ncbi:hypothetical protein [Intestinibacter sp.]
MKKKFISLLALSILLFTTSFVNSYAATTSQWYYSTITLPKYVTTGQLYWTTIERTATVINTGTGVSYPTYKVYSRICTSSGKYISTDLLHATNTSEPRWHKTDVIGAKIKACFRNSQTEVHTNRVNLRWKP